jgi:hypothetical protein
MLTTTIGVRLDPQDRELLEKVYKLRGEDLSSLTRRVIRKELASLIFYRRRLRRLSDFKLRRVRVAGD